MTDTPLNLPVPAIGAFLLARMDAYDAYAARLNAAQASKAEWEFWSEQGTELMQSVLALPNVPEHLRVRARAVGCGTDNTADLANLNLGELSAHARGDVGELVRQILVCCAGRSARPDDQPGETA